MEYSSTESKEDNRKTIEDRRDSTISTGNKRVNWWLYNFVQFDQNEQSSEINQTQQRGRIRLPPIVVNKKMVKNKRKTEKSAIDDDFTVIGLRHSQSDPVIHHIGSEELKSDISTDEPDIGLKRIKSEVLMSTEYFSHHEANNSERDTPKKKKKSLMTAVKRRLSFKKKQSKPEKAVHDFLATNHMHESKSEPVIHKSTSV